MYDVWCIAVREGGFFVYNPKIVLTLLKNKENLIIFAKKSQNNVNLFAIIKKKQYFCSRKNGSALPNNRITYEI